MQFNGDCQMLSGVQRFPIEKTIYVWNVFMIRWWLRRRTRQIFGTFSQYKILSMAMVNQFVLSYIGTWKPVCFIPAKLPCKVWYKVFIYHKKIKIDVQFFYTNNYADLPLSITQ